MLVMDRASGRLRDSHFREFPKLLREGDLLVLNNSRVIPARLFARRAGLRTQSNSPTPSGLVEVLLTQPLGENVWRALVKPARKVLPGERLFFHAPDPAKDRVDERDVSFRRPAAGGEPQVSESAVLQAEVAEAGEGGERTLRFEPVSDFFEALHRVGQVPLPPYIRRDAAVTEDRDRYQTVYAGVDAHGSAAAPTAGLHFTSDILAAIRARGVRVAYLTLHVGLGTFLPVRAEFVRDIRLHEEHYTLPGDTAAALLEAKAKGRRVVAVGTTTTRTLEHAAATGQLHAHSGSTSIFLSPGHPFALVDGLLTNFHLPESTLLMLVSAFAEMPRSAETAAAETGREKVLRAYRHAVAERYRFFSYGDCMFLS